MENNNTKNIAVFIDFENFARQETFDAEHLISQLKERGRLVVKRAYADWGRFTKYKRNMLENAIELTELPGHSAKGKNSADIKLVVDALEVAITKPHIDTIAIVSGDSDYTPLIAKLREYNKYVIVVAHRENSSELLKGACDELIYYSNLIEEDFSEESDITPAYGLLIRALNYLENQGIETNSSRVKSYMRQLDASFSETNYGFSKFKMFLQKAQQAHIVTLRSKKNSGDYIITPTEREITSAYTLLKQALQNLEAEDIETTSSRVKQQMIHLDAAFNESHYGFSKFKTFLHQAQRDKVVILRKKGGKSNYVITRSQGKDTPSSLTVDPVSLSPSLSVADEMLSAFRKRHMQFLGYELQDIVLKVIYEMLSTAQRPLTLSEFMGLFVERFTPYIRNKQLSKTKIGKVWQILYRGQCCIPRRSHDDSPVQYCLSPDITDYEELRKRHDYTLILTATWHGFLLSAQEWSELLYNQQQYVERTELLQQNARQYLATQEQNAEE